MLELHDKLRRICGLSGIFTEIRYHSRRARSIAVIKGELNEMSFRRYEGVGIRILQNGIWGFASTSDLSEAGLEKTLKTALEMAAVLAGRKKEKTDIAASSRLAKGEFILPGYRELEAMPAEQKLQMVRDGEQKLRDSSKSIESAQCSYTEIYEDKIIITTDGADCLIQLARPELRFSAFAADGSKRTRGSDSVGGTGGWECLFQNRQFEEIIDIASGSAVNLLTAGMPEGGRKKAVLSPAMVGLLSHEAIGHTVEADFVNSGSVAQGKIGTMVASPLVTLCDSGKSEHVSGAGGELPVDDEGILTEKTTVIENGKLVSYLHNRESALQYGVEPTGNARAWEFSDEPLIRMRNTCIEPGQDNLDDMIRGIDDGFFIDGPEGGQADATGEFMFGAARVRRITKGKLGDFVQKVTVSGNAFDVLKSVDAVSKDFKWDLGAGYCGKGQPAKVDAGGPFIRCELLVGGSQN